jgi:hypothetical protein
VSNDNLAEVEKIPERTLHSNLIPRESLSTTLVAVRADGERYPTLPGQVMILYSQQITEHFAASTSLDLSADFFSVHIT